MRGILAFVFFLLSAAFALAHEAPSGWSYDPYCCNGDSKTGDCEMIPSRTVTIVPGGYRVTLNPDRCARDEVAQRLRTHFHGPQRGDER